MSEEQAEENQDSAPTTRVLDTNFPTWINGPRRPIQRPSGLKSAWVTEPRVAALDTF